MEDTRVVWGESIRDVFPPEFSEALIQVSKEKQFRVKITQNNELGYNELFWSVEVEQPKEFQGHSLTEVFLGPFGTRKEAVDFCREMGWKIRRVTD